MESCDLKLLFVYLALSPIQSLTNPDTHLCDSDKECRGTITCAPDRDCLVKCTYPYACETADIYGPTNGDLEVICTDESCRGTIKKSLNIYGPKYGTLSVYCYAPERYGCRDINVDASAMISGELFVYGFGLPTTTWAFAIASRSRIQCPGNGNKCHVRCGNNGCGDDSTIYTQNDTALLEITVNGTNGLTAAYINCPKNGDCIIKSIGDNHNMFSDLTIYSETASISFYCNYTQNVSNCYDEALRPTLMCGSLLNNVCTLDLVSGYNGWECINGNMDDICEVPTLYPSLYPTKYPAKHPTKQPTYLPTFTPSFPTWVPTNVPTLYPAYSPTFYPSISPSIYPIKSTEKEEERMDEDDRSFMIIDYKFILFVGIIGILVLVVILCGILYCREKRKLKRVYEDLENVEMAPSVQINNVVEINNMYASTHVKSNNVGESNPHAKMAAMMNEMNQAMISMNQSMINHQSHINVIPTATRQCRSELSEGSNSDSDSPCALGEGQTTTES